MKNIVIFIAILMLFKPLWPLAEYVMNYDYIVEYLCTNKDRPELNCDGKCYLAKQLAKEAEGQEQNPFEGEKSTAEIHHIVFFQSLSQITLDGYLYKGELDNFKTVQKLTSNLFVTDFAQPPELG